MTVKAVLPVRFLNLVVPLAHKATDMRSRGTAGSSRAGLAQFHSRSARLRLCDVDRTK